GNPLRFKKSRKKLHSGLQLRFMSCSDCPGLPAASGRCFPSIVAGRWCALRAGTLLTRDLLARDLLTAAAASRCIRRAAGRRGYIDQGWGGEGKYVLRVPIADSNAHWGGQLIGVKPCFPPVPVRPRKTEGHAKRRADKNDRIFELTFINGLD